MAQASAESPKRGWMKAAEVCELAQVQPYVLRTWEMEFSDLGVVKSPGGPRVYRRADLDRVLRIKQLVFGEGLTLAGARRRIEEERAGSDELPFDDEPAPVSGTLTADTRRRIVKVRDELRGLLAMLSRPRGNGQPDAASLSAAKAAPARKAAPVKVVTRSTTKSKTASARGRK
jgi:DNA-binding transcriptional MerR regulator